MKLLKLVSLVALLSSCSSEAYGASTKGSGSVTDPAVQVIRSFLPRIVYTEPLSAGWFEDLISLQGATGFTVLVPHIQSGGNPNQPGIGSIAYVDIAHGHGERLLSLSYRALGNGSVGAIARIIHSPSPNAPATAQSIVSNLTDVGRSGAAWGSVAMPAFQPVNLTSDSVIYMFFQSTGPGYRVGQISATFESDIATHTLPDGT